ncbi:HD domain-containing protein [Candidatus Bathyarchaeota archaeon]|nr:HD domain-containing protein [Candidatus Bathyarchaeota archaeon]
MHHNWNHILRDLANGVILGEKEGANVKIVLVSVLLHDIGRLYPAKGKDHHTLGIEFAPRHLANSGFTKEFLHRDGTKTRREKFYEGG